MNAVALRLPLPADAGVSLQQWRVLTEAIFPTAKSAEAISLALEYCKARKLDVFKRPVHIVPMWNSALQRDVETIWPGINELQTTAARTGAWAGMDAPEWGPEKTRTFKGYTGSKAKGWKEISAEVTYPEWCSVTVYRMVEGQKCAFTEPVFWEESYARIGGGVVPNAMWQKRPKGQVHKVAKAAALRAAFPEEMGNDYVAEEMEGLETQAGPIIDGTAEEAPPPNKPPPKPPAPKAEAKPAPAPERGTPADRREQINADVPLKGDAVDSSSSQQKPKDDDNRQQSEDDPERAAENQWLEGLRIAAMAPAATEAETNKLFREGGRVDQAYQAAPERVRREIDAIKAEAYARFAKKEEPPPFPGASDEQDEAPDWDIPPPDDDDEVRIKGEGNLAAG